MNDIFDRCKKSIKENLPEFLYMAYFAIMLAAKGLGFYDGQTIYKLAFALTMLLVLIKIAITKKTFLEWIVVILLGTLALLVYLRSGEKGILVIAATILGMKGVSVKKVFNMSLYIWGTTFVGMIIYHLCNLESTGFKIHDKLGLGELIRWDMGYSHPNVFHISYLMLCMLIVYKLGMRFRWQHALLLLLGNAYIFLYSLSYTGVMITTLFIAISLYVAARGELTQAEYWISELAFPICVVLSLMAPILLPENLFSIVDKIFTNRLTLASVYLKPENITLRGNNLADITDSIFTMDNGYVFCLIIYGVMVFTLLMLGYILIIHRFHIQKKPVEIAIIICTAIAGITEPFVFNTSFKNMTLVFLGEGMYLALKYLTETFHITNTEIGILGTIPEDSNQDSEYQHDRAKTNPKMIMAIAIFCLLGGVVYTLRYAPPTMVIAPRVQADASWMEVVEPEYITIDEMNDYQAEGALVLQYQDENTPMQIFSGNITSMEGVRVMVSWIGVPITIIILYAIYTLHIKANKRNL